MAIKSQQEYYDIFSNELDAAAPDVTDRSQGSDVDMVIGIASMTADEAAFAGG